MKQTLLMNKPLLSKNSWQLLNFYLFLLFFILFKDIMTNCYKLPAEDYWLQLTGSGDQQYISGNSGIEPFHNN